MGPGEEGDVPLSLIQNREIWLTGTFRYANTYPTAIALAADGRVDLEAIITGHYGLDDAEAALRAGREDPGSEGHGHAGESHPRGAAVSRSLTLGWTRETSRPCRRGRSKIRTQLELGRSGGVGAAGLLSSGGPHRRRAPRSPNCYNALTCGPVDGRLAVT